MLLYIWGMEKITKHNRRKVYTYTKKSRRTRPNDSYYKSTTFRSIVEFQGSSFNDGKSLAVCRRFNKDGVRLIPNGLASNKSLREKEVVFHIKRLNSKLLKDTYGKRLDKPVGMYNLDGEQIATFVNPSMAVNMLGLRKDAINDMLYTEPKGYQDYTFRLL